MFLDNEVEQGAGVAPGLCLYGRQSLLFASSPGFDRGAYDASSIGYIIEDEEDSTVMQEALCFLRCRDVGPFQYDADLHPVTIVEPDHIWPGCRDQYATALL